MNGAPYSLHLFEAESARKSAQDPVLDSIYTIIDIVHFRTTLRHSFIENIERDVIYV